MSPIKHLDLTYEALNEEGTFSEGDTVSGRVTLTLEKDTKVKSFFVKAKGVAHVRWSEGTGDNRRSYSAHREYFKIKKSLTGNETDTVLSKGVHNFKFRITLPNGELPSSFKAIHGSVAYTLEAKLSRSWRMPSKAGKTLTFFSKSLMQSPHVMCPQYGSVNKDVGTFSKGQVQMSASLNKMFCAPGDILSVEAKINNLSSKATKAKFSLQQKIVYRAIGKTKTQDTSLCKGVGETIAANTESVASCQMQIPVDTVYSLQNCDILSNSYYLKVYLDISFAIDPEVVFPLVIIPASFANFQASRAGGPGNSDFPPPAFPAGPYQTPPGPGPYGYSTPYPAQPENATGGYINQWPQNPAPSSFPPPTLPSSSVPFQTPTAPPLVQHGEGPPSYVDIYPSFHGTNENGEFQKNHKQEEEK
ncbi:arrestin domain-containing protein 3-like [Echeneis naucrates]|uniref:arrestin domain-containing protein 3-like n=1 Tax=Echeneis naucrates TaxID=173247 RepID=UPI001113480C|nr:arrestin domain-containing protein 3-like [Echeneis naucrates]